MSRSTTPSARTTSNSTSAPLGIQILCVLSGLLTLFAVLFGVVLLASGSGAGVLAGLVVLGLSALQFVVLWGLWTVQPWGWTLAMVLYGLNAVLQVLNLVLGDVGALLGLPITLGIMAYVYSKRDVYRGPSGGASMRSV